MYVVKKTDIKRERGDGLAASGTIDGSGSISLPDQYDWLMLEFDGTNWVILAGSIFNNVIRRIGRVAARRQAHGNSASYVAVSGLTGATAGCRYVGATASGHPTSGTFAVGDLVIAQNGKLWCLHGGGVARHMD